jgi:hypothetical protein
MKSGKMRINLEIFRVPDINISMSFIDGGNLSSGNNNIFGVVFIGRVFILEDDTHGDNFIRVKSEEFLFHGLFRVRVFLDNGLGAGSENKFKFILIN